MNMILWRGEGGDGGCVMDGLSGGGMDMRGK